MPNHNLVKLILQSMRVGKGVVEEEVLATLSYTYTNLFEWIQQASMTTHGKKIHQSNKLTQIPIAKQCTEASGRINHIVSTTWALSLPDQIFPKGRANFAVCSFSPNDRLPHFHVIYLILSLIGTGVFMAVQDSLRQLMIYLAGSNLSYSHDLYNMNISLWNLILQMACVLLKSLSCILFVHIKPYLYLSSSTIDLLSYKYYSTSSNFLKIFYLPLMFFYHILLY